MTLDTTTYAVPVARGSAALRHAVADWRKAGQRVGFVPTMGALHEGHLALVDLARERAERVIVSIFVNPAQFAPHEDFDAYPRDEAADAELLAAHGCDLIYAPSRLEIYPPDFATEVRVGGPSAGLETDFRPHFFAGVATIVSKLLIQVAPDVAVFGEKDYQQLLVIRQLVRDLDLPVEIVAGPVIREADGLALSSRNAYLSAEERKAAPKLHEVIATIARNVSQRATIAPEIEQGCDVLRAAGFDPIDYIAVRDAETLTEIANPERPARVLAAAWLGKTRLIDNVPLDPA
jgi:pantoate--beta-alanine ligase